MQNVIVSRGAICKNGYLIQCRYCGERIEEGELAVRTVHCHRGGKLKVFYAHKACDEAHRV